MISILIPTYNYNITGLVSDLHKQAIELQTGFEIIVIDDASQLFLKENAGITSLTNCFYYSLAQNAGRSAVRNKLADLAKYRHLLFIDCDAGVHKHDFLSRYLPFCNDKDVVVGGTAYDSENNHPEFSLRLKYGRKREANEDYHQLSKQSNFSTFNFLIPASIFQQIRFDERIKGYGHEDTLFGHQLHMLGYRFIRIDNPLIHLGLDENRLFLKKTEESVINLLKLHLSGNYPFLIHESKLLNWLEKVQKLHISGLLIFKFRKIRRYMEAQLCSRNPSLRIYDLYKLFILIQENRILTR